MFPLIRIVETIEMFSIFITVLIIDVWVFVKLIKYVYKNVALKK